MNEWMWGWVFYPLREGQIESLEGKIQLANNCLVTIM